MLENFNNNVELKFKDLSQEEKTSRGILGRLYGPIASIVTRTRNNRKYPESLWEKVFENPVVKELFAHGGIPGELDHPVDREETNSEKIAIMMPEPPTKDKDGHLIGYFDIIDTPCGRIAYALAKYGFDLGISSRGYGETIDDYDGGETVDEDNYVFNAFDLVLLPACKDARLKLTESFDIKKNKFNEDINTLLKNSNEKDKAIIHESLNQLNQKIEELEKEDSQEENNKEDLNTQTNPVSVETDEEEKADDIGSELVQNLQEALKNKKSLQAEVTKLQEKLSVSYTKEIKNEAAIIRLKKSVKKLTEEVKKEKVKSSKVESLRERLETLTQEQEHSDHLIKEYKEKLNNYSLQNSELKEQLTVLKSNLDTIKNSAKNAQQSLQESITQLKEDSKIKNDEYSQKLAKANKLVESSRKIAAEAVNKYIESKAINLGVDPREIKNKLSENYSFDDIDLICEDLRSYKRNISKLPFNFSNQSISKITSNNSSAQRFTNQDDVIDEGLLNLLNNN